MLKLGKTRARGSRVGSRMEQIHPAGVKVGKGGGGRSPRTLIFFQTLINIPPSPTFSRFIIYFAPTQEPWIIYFLK